MKHLSNVPGMIIAILVVSYWGWAVYLILHPELFVLIQ